MPLPIICKELQERAKKELNEDPSKINESLNHLRNWLNGQPHLNVRTDDQSLINFLRVSKFDLNATKERIDVFYTCKTIIPEFFCNRDPLSSEVQEVFKRGIMIVLPKTVKPAEPRLILKRATCADPEFVSIVSYTKAMLMTLDVLCMEDPNATISGMILIMDLKGLPYKYVSQFTPSYIKKVITCVLSAYPIQLQAVYYINAPLFFKGVYSALKLFLSEEIKKRICFYSRIEDFYKDIPKSVFPEDYGGMQPSCDELSDEWRKKVESYRDWFINDEEFCSNEAKRPGKPKTSKNVFE